MSDITQEHRKSTIRSLVSIILASKMKLAKEKVEHVAASTENKIFIGVRNLAEYDAKVRSAAHKISAYEQNMNVPSTSNPHVSIKAPPDPPSPLCLSRAISLPSSIEIILGMCVVLHILPHTLYSCTIRCCCSFSATCE